MTLPQKSNLLRDETKELISATAARLGSGSTGGRGAVSQSAIKASVGVVANGEHWITGERTGEGTTDIYEIGSVTKVFTSTLLSVMVGEGTVGLDDAVSAFLPELRFDERITLKHLATHTSGLPRVPKELLTNLDRANPYARFDDAALLRCLDGIKLTKPPGQRHQYSNLGAAVLGFVLARRAELPFEDLVEQRLCAPLGLQDTRIHLTKPQQERLAPAHTARGRPAVHWELASFAPAGALRSTTRDLLEFAIAQSDTSHPLGSAFERARTPQHRCRGYEIGLGWFLSPLEKTTEVWHTGGTGGAASYLGFVPERHVAVAILVNRCLSLTDALLWNRVEHAGRRLLRHMCRSA